MSGCQISDNVHHSIDVYNLWNSKVFAHNLSCWSLPPHGHRDVHYLVEKLHWTVRVLSSWSLVPRTPHDALERRVVDSAGLLTDETRLEALGVE